MSHLSPERLAALIDEQPTAAELAHLAGCRPCARERGAYEALAAMTQGSSTIGSPLTSWEKLAPALRDDRVIESDIGRMRRVRALRGFMQAAAAVILLTGGVVFGRITADSSTRDVVTQVSEGDVQFASIEDAQAAAAKSQNLYQASMAYLAARDTNSLSVATPAVIKARLAALDQVTQIAGAALENAPYDPVVNNLYLSARGQRDASVRMLNTASTRLTTY
jgi:hypothetical protein